MTDQPDDTVLITPATPDTTPIISPADPRLALLPLPLFDTPEDIPAEALQQPLASTAVGLGWLPTVTREDMYLEARRGGYGPYGQRRGYGDADDSEPKTAATEKEPKETTDRSDRVSRIPTYFPISVAGQGITSALARACRRTEIPLIGLVALAYRGDNKANAHAIAQKAHELLGVRAAVKEEVKWVEPAAWKYLYGAESEHTAAWE